MTTPVVDPAALALEMVDLRRWGARGQLFALAVRLQAADGFDGFELSQWSAAEATGLDRRYCHQLLGRLVDERVFDVVKLGRGRRATRYRISPDPRRWVGVPLRVDAELAMWRLLALEGPLPRRVSNEVVTRSRARHNAPDPLVKALVTALRAVASDATWIASQRESLRRDMDRVTNEPPTDRDTSSFGVRASPSLEGPRERSADARALIGAIESATACDVWGSAADRAEALAERHDVDQLVAWCAEAAGTGLRPPGLLARLERLVELGAGGRADPITRRRWLEGRVATLRGLVGALADDDEDPLGVVYRHELRACEDELAELEGR